MIQGLHLTHGHSLLIIFCHEIMPVKNVHVRIWIYKIFCCEVIGLKPFESSKIAQALGYVIILIIIIAYRIRALYSDGNPPKYLHSSLFLSSFLFVHTKYYWCCHNKCACWTCIPWKSNAEPSWGKTPQLHKLLTWRVQSWKEARCIEFPHSLFLFGTISQNAVFSFFFFFT